MQKKQGWSTERQLAGYGGQGNQEYLYRYLFQFGRWERHDQDPLNGLAGLAQTCSFHRGPESNARKLTDGDNLPVIWTKPTNRGQSQNDETWFRLILGFAAGANESPVSCLVCCNIPPQRDRIPFPAVDSRLPKLHTEEAFQDILACMILLGSPRLIPGKMLLPLFYRKKTGSDNPTNFNDNSHWEEHLNSLRRHTITKIPWGQFPNDMIQISESRWSGGTTVFWPSGLRTTDLCLMTSSWIDTVDFFLHCGLSESYSDFNKNEKCTFKSFRAACVWWCVNWQVNEQMNEQLVIKTTTSWDLRFGIEMISFREFLLIQYRKIKWLGGASAIKTRYVVHTVLHLRTRKSVPKHNFSLMVLTKVRLNSWKHQTLHLPWVSYQEPCPGEGWTLLGSWTLM